MAQLGYDRQQVKALLCGVCLAVANFVKMQLVDRLLLGNAAVTPMVCQMCIRDRSTVLAALAWMAEISVVGRENVFSLIAQGLRSLRQHLSGNLGRSSASVRQVPSISTRWTSTAITARKIIRLP